MEEISSTVDQKVENVSPNEDVLLNDDEKFENGSSNEDQKTDNICPNNDQKIEIFCPNEDKKFDNIQSIDVLHFDRSVRKKCRFPNHRENLVDILKESEKEFESIEKSLEGLPKNFCKKDLKTGIQKQFECQACKCLIESLLALQAHIKGEKHAKAMSEFRYTIYIM